MKKIKPKDIEKNKQKIAEEVAVSEVEKPDIIKYVAFQLVFGTLITIALIVITYIAGINVVVAIAIVAYFPYIYIKKDAEKIVHFVTWAVYLGVIAITVFRI
jgi:hypothetical protein